MTTGEVQDVDRPVNQEFSSFFTTVVWDGTGIATDAKPNRLSISILIFLSLAKKLELLGLVQQQPSSTQTTTTTTQSYLPFSSRENPNWFWGGATADMWIDI